MMGERLPLEVQDACKVLGIRQSQVRQFRVTAEEVRILDDQGRLFSCPITHGACLALLGRGCFRVHQPVTEERGPAAIAGVQRP